MMALNATATIDLVAEQMTRVAQMNGVPEGQMQDFRKDFMTHAYCLTVSHDMHEQLQKIATTLIKKYTEKFNPPIYCEEQSLALQGWKL